MFTIPFFLLSKLIFRVIRVSRLILESDEGVYPPLEWADLQDSITEIQKKIDTIEKERICGEPESPLSASAMKDETRRSGGNKE